MGGAGSRGGRYEGTKVRECESATCKLAVGGGRRNAEGCGCDGTRAALPDRERTTFAPHTPPAMSSEPRFVPLDFRRLPEEEMLRRARETYAEMDRRRTTRHFAPDPVPRELVELAIRAAGTAPSGAHQQPWTFAVVSDPALKARIREAAEEEERAS
jgi:hypothetical protein